MHTTFDDNINDAILHAIFADGCAAAVIGGETKSTAKPVDGGGERWIDGWISSVVDRWMILYVYVL